MPRPSSHVAARRQQHGHVSGSGRTRRVALVNPLHRPAANGTSCQKSSSQNILFDEGSWSDLGVVQRVRPLSVRRTLTSRETGLRATARCSDSARVSPPNLPEPRASLTPPPGLAAAVPPPVVAFTHTPDDLLPGTTWPTAVPAASANDMAVGGGRRAKRSFREKSPEVTSTFTFGTTRAVVYSAGVLFGV